MADDHLRELEKGTVAVTVQPSVAGYFAETATRVWLGSGSLAPRAPSASATGSESSSTATCCTAMPGSVSVPVLSTQTTSTRASTSTAGMSWTRAFFCARRMTDTAIATLVRSTSPSGTIVMTPGTVPAIEARMSPSFARYCEMNRNTPTGTRNHDTTLMKRWIE